MLSLQLCLVWLLPVCLPVSILQQLLLVIQQLLTCLCAELKVGALHNGIHRARLLQGDGLITTQQPPFRQLPDTTTPFCCKVLA